MIFLVLAQEDTAAVVDTLTSTYSDKWDGQSGFEHAGPAIQAFASHDLIFIVLAVSLIIWFILLFFIIRVDKKVGRLEQEIELSNSAQNHET